ncbi:general amino-acid permease GAP1 [Aspergillus campestris IBT 28561]|uniref:General amino-acid permease GAP1 n=1 Tax=Aspergillus campestris (strain IBT 28561) TaxID=1392248 RepID=A0A2I1CUH0_ASPC2|nr:general amino-acid permease GAP1 [Aspergillus campestris IBT 28561]PKY01259.1 general amino-acid permease GAP1 [Aspergillus campestris IBT 28561]
MEKDEIGPAKDKLPPSPDATPVHGDAVATKAGLGRRIIDSFKRDPNAHVSVSSSGDGKSFDIEHAAQKTAASPLQRKLKGRHLQMIAIGGSIGTGLFVGSGKVLATGGPASLLIAYILIGCMLYCTVHALGEMAVLFPVAGSFAHYSTRFIDPAWGFAMGWNYALQWLVVLPLEIVAASITVDFWESDISNAAWVAIFWTMIVSINLFGVRGYGEAEFVFSLIKVVAVIGFIILGIILNCGGGPKGGYIGGKYWHDPGAFNNGFKGLCSVFVNAAFAFAGTELVGLAAAETANPRKSLPGATKQVFWRISLFYVVSLTLVGLLVPSNDERLMNGSSSADAKASPFVIAIQNAGIQALPSIMNVVIMIAVLSVGNASVYGSSRTLAALAEQRQAPQFLAYIDRQGRPLWAICVSSALGLLGFLSASSKQEVAFEWMMAISGLSSVLTWGSVCLAHIRFRRAWKVQGHSLKELAFTSQPGLVGSWIGFGFNCLVLIAQFWVGFAPVGYAEKTPMELAYNFFAVYLAAPVVLAFYIPYKLWYKTPFLRARDMDLQTGRRDLDIQYLIDQERAEQASWPAWKKFYKLFC